MYIYIYMYVCVCVYNEYCHNLAINVFIINYKLYSGDSGSKHEEDAADDEGEDGANVREGDAVDDKDGVRSISPILKPVVAREEEERLILFYLSD